MKKDTYIMTQEDKTEVHTHPEIIDGVVRHTIPWKNYKEMDLQESFKVMDEVQKKYAGDESFNIHIEHVCAGILLDIYLDGSDAVIATKGDGVVGEVIRPDIGEWIFPPCKSKVEEPIVLKCSLGFQGLPNWTTEQTVKHLHYCIRNGFTEYDLSDSRLRLRILEMYVNGVEKDVTDYFDYVSGPINGLFESESATYIGDYYRCFVHKYKKSVLPPMAFIITAFKDGEYHDIPEFPIYVKLEQK